MIIRGMPWDIIEKTNCKKINAPDDCLFVMRTHQWQVDVPKWQYCKKGVFHDTTSSWWKIIDQLLLWPPPITPLTATIWLIHHRCKMRWLISAYLIPHSLPRSLDTGVLGMWVCIWSQRWWTNCWRIWGRTAGRRVYSWYSALSIYCGHYSLTISRKTHHSSPVRARYGVSFVDTKSGRTFTIVTIVVYVLISLTACVVNSNICTETRESSWYQLCHN